ncbi:MAG: leucine-rich repeat domain-containing protein [Ruminococcus sp.]|nr:leucine-rich repeat domain-containing protein [Ruminococcus sp.]
MHLKRLSAMLLAAWTLTAALPALPAAAADEDFSMTLLEDGTAQITCINKTLQTVEIPATLNGYPVTALAEGCFAEFTDLTAVTMPDSLTTIGESAFFGCTALESVTIPESVTTIDAIAFSGCTALTEFTIPASVTQIGDYVFDNCELMTEITVAAENTAYASQDGVLFTKDMATLLKYPESRPDTAYTVPQECKTIANWSFIGAQYLEEIDLGSVTSIGEDAFYYCVGLKHITVPEGITALADGTFCYCAGLQSVTLPSTLRSIGENCFFSCTSLTDIALPEGLEAISPYAFFHCISLESLTIPPSVVTMTSCCIGYCYDEAAQGNVVQENFTALVTRASPAYRFASSNDIAWKLYYPNLTYYLLIGAAVAAILGLSIAIAVVLKKRR